MKRNRFYAYIDTPKGVKSVGWYLAVDKESAKILARADAIKMGCDYKLVRVFED